jgi:hypothetical protein
MSSGSFSMEWLLGEYPLAIKKFKTNEIKVTIG